MLTFSINQVYNTQLCADALGLIEELTPYLRCIYHKDLDEYKHRILEIVLKNYDSEKGDLKHYIMATAKKMRLSKSKEIAIDTFDMENPLYNLEKLQQDNKIIVGDSGTSEVLFCDTEQIENTLRDIYLLDENAFNLLYDTLIVAQDLQKGVKITNNEIKALFLNCVRDFGADVVTTILHKIHTSIYNNERGIEEKGINIIIKEPTKTYKNKLKTQGILQTVGRESIVMNEDTLLLSYLIDSKPWLRVKKNTSKIYRIGYSDIVDDIYRKAFSSFRKNNEYIQWCGNRYKCFALSGKAYLNIDQNEYFDLVRKEIVSSIIKRINCSIVGCTPDNIYIQTAKPLDLTYIDMENYIGSKYRCLICEEEERV